MARRFEGSKESDSKDERIDGEQPLFAPPLVAPLKNLRRVYRYRALRKIGFVEPRQMISSCESAVSPNLPLTAFHTSLSERFPVSQPTTSKAAALIR